MTFTYDRYSRYEVPVNAVIQRIRSDVSWEEIQRDSEENSSQTQVLTGILSSFSVSSSSSSLPSHHSCIVICCCNAELTSTVDYTNKVMGNFTQKPLGYWKSEKSMCVDSFFLFFLFLFHFFAFLFSNTIYRE